MIAGHHFISPMIHEKQMPKHLVQNAYCREQVVCLGACDERDHENGRVFLQGSVQAVHCPTKCADSSKCAAPNPLQGIHQTFGFVLKEVCEQLVNDVLLLQPRCRAV